MKAFLGAPHKTRAMVVRPLLEPMMPSDRRIVHLAVSEDPAVTSESIGDAFLKTVVISPS